MGRKWDLYNKIRAHTHTHTFVGLDYDDEITEAKNGVGEMRWGLGTKKEYMNIFE